MARQWTAKQAIDAQNGVTTPVAPPVAPVAPTTPTPINTPAPVTAPTPITPPTTPRVEGQWNYGTNEAQVLGEKPTVAPTQPTPTVKPASASQAIAQGFKQEIKPVAKGANAPLTTEIGREAKLGQLPTVQQAQNQAEQDKINTANLKSQSGQQLWSNLETISGANQSLLNDRKAFDQAFGYDNKDVSEKALVDAFWKSKRLDANGIYNSLATGATIPKESKNTPAFTDALIRHQDTTRFENLNPYQLSKVINSELIPGTQTYNDLMAKNPQLVTDAMKLASINAPVTARQETKTNWQDNLSAYLSRSPVMSNPTTVATIMNSDPNIATKTNEVQAVEDKLTEAKDRLKKVQENVTERYKGTGATKQTINAKALAESQDIIDEITMLEANKASASSALTTLIQNAKDNYTYARQDRIDALDQYNKGFAQLQAMAEMGMAQDAQEYKKQQDAVNRDLQLLQYYTNIDQANAKEARGYDFQTQQDLRNFEQQKELAKMGYIQDERMSNINFNNDIRKLWLQQSYDTSKTATQNQLDMIKSAMAQGSTYQDAVNQVMGTGGGIDRQTAISQYGSTPAVRNFNPGNITDTWFGGQKVEWERFTRFNTPQEWFNALVSKIQNIQAGNSKVYSPNMSLLRYISKYAPASDNNNPTAYANGIAKNLGISPNTQLKDIDPNALAMEHARHEDGNMYKMLQDLWINSKQAIPQPEQTTATARQYSDSDLALLQGIDKLDGSTNKILAQANLSPKDWALFKDGKLPPTNTQYRTSSTISDTIDKLLNHPGLSDAVGTLKTPGLIPGTDRKDFDSLLTNFRDTLVLPNLGNLKGAMSDKDIEFLRNTASSLNVDGTEKQFIDSLKEIQKKQYEVMNRWVTNGQAVAKWTAFDPEVFAKAIAERINNR